ncbi:MAG: UDP-N-acetylmuramate dehydrogenase [Omnitrophica bacterium]|nr:UDP-N-acetylmuramate dehydrogenase [Candidatus Omnitrophota bacterium]
MPWLNDLKVRIRFREPLSAHTTLRIGGPADAWVEPESLEELKEIICRLNKERRPYFVIGKGSNILAGDKGFRGGVICLNSPAFTKIEAKGTSIVIGGGLALSSLIRQAAEWGLGGLEFLAGIPASVGGALITNAGTPEQGIGGLVKSVTVMDKAGKVYTLGKKELKFSYRKSNLNRYIVLGSVLQLIKRRPRQIENNIAKNLFQKRRTQDLDSKSAGCIFKNPRHRLSAGRLIELCGLKGRRCGGAEVSMKHGNYIINRSGAKAKDILYLMDLAQREVKKSFGVDLKPEIKII